MAHTFSAAHTLALDYDRGPKHLEPASGRVCAPPPWSPVPSSPANLAAPSSSAYGACCTFGHTGTLYVEILLKWTQDTDGCWPSASLAVWWAVQGSVPHDNIPGGQWAVPRWESTQVPEAAYHIVMLGSVRPAHTWMHCMQHPRPARGRPWACLHQPQLLNARPTWQLSTKCSGAATSCQWSAASLQDRCQMETVPGCAVFICTPPPPPLYAPLLV